MAVWGAGLNLLFKNGRMAFEMYAGPYTEWIGHHEEFVLELASGVGEGGRYPQLSALWKAFYDSPRLSPVQANALVHELIHLLAANGGSKNKPLAAVVFRLMTFFSAAYVGGLQVNCSSD